MSKSEIKRLAHQDPIGTAERLSAAESRIEELEAERQRLRRELEASEEAGGMITRDALRLQEERDAAVAKLEAIRGVTLEWERQAGDPLTAWRTEATLKDCIGDIVRILDKD